MSIPITSNPIPTSIPQSDLGIRFEAIARIPNSGINNQQAPRLNFIQSPHDGSERLFVNDMRGKLYVIDDEIVSEYLDLKTLVGADFIETGGQQGFISFVFDPNFKNNGIFYTVHTEIKGDKIPDFSVNKTIFDNQGNLISSSHHDVLTQWITRDPQSNIFNGDRREILRIEQPYPEHNLGEIAFNPNALPGSEDYGLLYIAAADGGSGGFPVSKTDPLNNGQDLSVPLGKILRIDPNGNNSPNGKYGIPNYNPFVNDNNSQTLGEIWAYGLRNPHRFSWDTGGDGKLFIVDIGQSFIEEINLGVKGANYGWGNREGTFLIDENNEAVLYPLPADDSLNNYTYPVAQYDHDVPTSVAIAGGFVYRGQAIPELQGQYIFADFATDGRFFTVDVDDLVNGQQAPLEELRIYNGTTQTTFLNLLGKLRSDLRFGSDETGEMYVINKQDGIVRQIIAAMPTTDDIFYGAYRSQIFDGKEGFDQVIYRDLNIRLTLTASDQVIKTGTASPILGTWTDQLISIEKIEGNLTQINTINAGDAGDRRIEVNLETNQFKVINSDAQEKAIAVMNFRNVIGSQQNDTIKGNSLNNRLEGGQGNDQLDGSLGSDTLIGGLGDDVYIVDNTSGDKITELANQGMDNVQAKVTYTLPVHVENLTLMGTGNINGIGNNLDNQIIGNNGRNRLDGNAGADMLRGELGNDTYIVDNLGDQVVENPNAGTDSIQSSISYQLGDNLENLTLLGSDSLNGTGNGLNNQIFGNGGNNVLMGGEGNDVLDGKAGADILLGGKGNDTLNLGLNDGSIDLIRYTAGDGRDMVNYFVKGVDQLVFIDVPFIDVTSANGNTLLRVGNGIQGDSGFGGGQLLLTLQGVMGLTPSHVGMNGTNLGEANSALFFFA